MSGSAPVSTSPSLLSGGAAVACARGFSQVSQIAIFIAGARLLGPEEFGLFALTFAVAVLGAILAQAGWKAYVLSWRGREEVLRQVLLAACLSGLATGAMGLVAAMAAGRHFPGDGIDGLIVLFSIWICLVANVAPQNALLVRRGRLVAASACQILGEAAGLAVAMGLLYLGGGILALGAGKAVAQGVELLVLLVFTRTLPAPAFETGAVRDLTAFSWQIIKTNIVFHGRAYLGTFLAGGFLGPASAGLFRAAQRLVGAVHDVLAEPAQQLAWIILRRAAEPYQDVNSPEAVATLQGEVERYFPLLLALVAPVYLVVVIMAGEIFVVILGEEWRAAAIVASVLALGTIPVIPAVLTEPLLALRGQIHWLPKVSLVVAMFAVAVTVPSAPLGLMALAWAHLAVGLFAFAAIAWLHVHVLGLSWRKIGARCLFLVPMLLAFAVMLVGLRKGFAATSLGPLASLAASVVPAMALYLATLSVLHPGLRALLLGSIRRGARRGT